MQNTTSHQLGGITTAEPQNLTMPPPLLDDHDEFEACSLSRGVEDSLPDLEEADIMYRDILERIINAAPDTEKAALAIRNLYAYKGGQLWKHFGSFVDYIISRWGPNDPQLVIHPDDTITYAGKPVALCDYKIIVPIEYREALEKVFPNLIPPSLVSAAPEQQQPTSSELQSNFAFSLKHAPVEDTGNQSAPSSQAYSSHLDLVKEFAGILINNDDNTVLVDARSLHKKLNASRNFSSWMKQRVQGFGLILDYDYGLRSHRMGSKGVAIKRKDYWLKLDVASLVALMEEGDQGKQISRYIRRIQNHLQDEAKCKAMIDGVQEQLQMQQNDQITLSRNHAILLKGLIAMSRLNLQEMRQRRIAEQEFYEAAQLRRKSEQVCDRA